MPSPRSCAHCSPRGVRAARRSHVLPKGARSAAPTPWCRRRSRRPGTEVMITVAGNGGAQSSQRHGRSPPWCERCTSSAGAQFRHARTCAHACLAWSRAHQTAGASPGVERVDQARQVVDSPRAPRPMLHRTAHVDGLEQHAGYRSPEAHRCAARPPSLVPSGTPCAASPSQLHVNTHLAPTRVRVRQPFPASTSRPRMRLHLARQHEHRRSLGE